jgi:misacylated tRNA(Ala) deacylase
LVEIDGIDLNACCGTHVENASHLQIIKLFGKEKTRGHVRLSFCVGMRCAAQLDAYWKRSNELGAILSAGVDDHVLLVEKLKSEQKKSNKKIQSLLKEVAEFEALKAQERVGNEECKYFLYVREDADMTFLKTISKAVSSKNSNILQVLIGDGQFYLCGEPTSVSHASTEICQLLNGKGGGGKGTFQGKFLNNTDSKTLKAIESLLII